MPDKDVTNYYRKINEQIGHEYSEEEKVNEINFENLKDKLNSIIDIDNVLPEKKLPDEIKNQAPDEVDDGANDFEKQVYLHKLFKFSLIVKSYRFKKVIAVDDVVDKYFRDEKNIEKITETFKTMMGAVYFPTFDVMKENIEYRISALKKDPTTHGTVNLDNYIYDTKIKNTEKRFIMNSKLLSEDIYNQNFKNEFNRFMKEYLNEELGKEIEKVQALDIDKYKKLSKKYSDNVKFLYGYLSDKVEMLYEDSKNLKIDVKKLGELNLLYKLMELYNSQNGEQGRTFEPIIKMSSEKLKIKVIPDQYTFLDENSLFYAKSTKKIYYTTTNEGNYKYDINDPAGGSGTKVTPGDFILDIENNLNEQFRNDIANDCAVYYCYNKSSTPIKRELILTLDKYDEISKEADYSIKERKIISKKNYELIESDPQKKIRYISREGLVNVEIIEEANALNVEYEYKKELDGINNDKDNKFNINPTAVGDCIHQDLNDAVNNIEKNLKEKNITEIPFYFFVSAVSSKTWQAGIHSSLLILLNGKYYSFGFGYSDNASSGLAHMVETINGAIYTPDYLIATDLFSSSDFNKRNPFASKAFKYKIGDYGIFNRDMYNRTINILKGVDYKKSFYSPDEKCFMLITPEIKYCELSGQGTKTSNCSNFALTIVGGDRINCDLRPFTYLPYFFKGMLIDLPYYCVRNNLMYYNPTEFVIELFNCQYNDKGSDEYNKSFNKMIKWCDIPSKNKLFRFFGDKVSYVPGVVLQAYRTATKKKGGKKSKKTTRRKHRNDN